MKKQIALLATLIAACGFTATAFGQDWITINTSAKVVWDNYNGSGSSTTPTIDNAGSGTLDAILLWAPTGTSDQLPSVGTSFGLGGTGTALDQVATNALSVGSANPISTINAMLGAGWKIASDVNNNNTNAIANNGGATAKGEVEYNSGSPFEVTGLTGASGSSIEEILVAYNATASSWLTASDLGWSNPFSNIIGTSSGDPNATQEQALANQFGVAAVPEPATLALAGLGGLSMLFLRRRKS